MVNEMDQNRSQISFLWLNNNEREVMKDFWTVYDAHHDEIISAVMNVVISKPELASLTEAIPADQLAEQRRISRERMRRAIFDSDWESYIKTLRTEGENYGKAEVGYSAWYELFSAYRSQVIHLLFKEYGQDLDRLHAVLSAHSKFSDQVMATISEAYLNTMENTIHQQQEAILDLSTPVLVLRERMLLLPIVGLLDSHRAQQLTEHLLHAIRNHRALVVVIDITGVLTVDSMVANHLIKTAEAARLMGAKAIVTGLSTEIAQTLVRIGVDLSQLNTLGDLRSGIEAAERYLGYRLVKERTERIALELKQDDAI